MPSIKISDQAVANESLVALVRLLAREDARKHAALEGAAFQNSLRKNDNIAVTNRLQVSFTNRPEHAAVAAMRTSSAAETANSSLPHPATNQGLQA